MTLRDRDFDEVLTRVLRAAADSIEPAPDGLERIRARLTTPQPLAAAWLMASYTEYALPALIWIRSLFDGLVAWLQAVPDPPPRGPGGGSLTYRLSRRYGWLRPAAFATAIVVAVAGGYGLTQLRSTMLETGEQILPLPGFNPPAQGGSVQSHGSNPITAPSGSPGAGSGRRNAQPSSSASCAPGPLGPTPAPSAVPSPTTAPSPTPTPTPTPTDTTSASPSTSAAAGTGGSPVASPAGVVYLGPADPGASPQPSKQTRSAKPCGTVLAPQPGGIQHSGAGSAQ